MLKIKASELLNFIKKTTADGQVEDCSLRLKPEGLSMIHKDEAGVILIGGVLSKSSFSEYEEMVINVKDTKVLLDTLKSFKDNIINIVKKDNMMRILDEDGGFDLALAESVKCVKDAIPEFAYDNKSLIKKSSVLTILERNKIVKSDEIKVNMENKEITFEIGKESDKAHTKTLTSYEGKKNVSFDYTYFQTIVSNLDPVFDISFDKDFPSLVEEKTDKYTIKYFLTPMSESK
jgi:hypothetical protein